MPSARLRQACVHASAVLLALLVSLGLGVPAAQAQGQEPGVTMRVFQLPRALTEICPIKPGQTPNVDELKQTIDWEGDEVFGGPTNNFIVHAIANITVPTAGEYTFRLRSDDGSELLIDDSLVIDHDGLHGAEDMDGTVTLTAGVHALRVNFFEAGGGQELRLSWRPPGASGFSIVPTSVLTTDTAVRVTAPGTKECEGDVDSPGDGLPLAGVNPAYDLVNLRPAGFEPKVTGLEWMGDDLLVLTWGDDDGDPSSVTAAGEVWKLSGVKDADDPADVTRTLIATELREPMGIKVVEGEIYVSEKHRLVKLLDPAQDGTYEGRDEIATWPFDGNFHEFAFGLLYKDGFFYLNLSVSIDLGGATTVPQGSPDRGTQLKIAKDTGVVEHVAGGLRTPHGIGWGPEGEIFTTDNQGGWLPANKLIHVQPGKFYNHYTTGPEGQPGRFDHERPTPPALWLPHNEIANSPSQPMLIPTGPFAGQMWVADVTYGGIQRAFLEKVEGEYQGAYFRMTQGLESGLTHLLAEPDGTIIVGGLGAGGNWGQEGKLEFGLQKLVPNGTETFDIQRMELTEEGFDLTYTKPLSAETLEDIAEKYVVRQWGYAPTSAYGGPKIGEETLAVTGATASADGRTVSLEIAGLKPNRVVYVRSPRPFEAEGGEPLLSTEAWYTLNKLPGYVAPAGGLYELEDGQLAGGAQFDTEHAGFSGTGYVSGYGTVGASTTIDVNAETAGDYRLALRYANGPHPAEGPKTISLIVNGERRQITLPSTGTWPNYQLYVDTVALDAGANTIELRYTAEDVGHVNLDSLRLAPAGTTRYEAEAGTLAGGANVQTEHPGYSGTGYVGGYQNVGASTTLEVIALADGPAEITLGYANGPHPAPGTKEVSVYVNGNFAKKFALPSTGQWADYGVFTQTLVLRAGANDISIRFDEGDEGNVNLDFLDLEQNEPIQCEPGTEPDDAFDGEANRPLPLDDDPQRGSGRLRAARRRAAHRRAGGRHRRHQRQRPQRAAAAGPDRRQLGGAHQGVDRRHRRLPAGRAGGARELVRVGQARGDAQPGGPVAPGARPRVRLAEQRGAARRRAERHHARAVRHPEPAARALLARRRRDLDRGRRRVLAERPGGAGHRGRRVQRHGRGGGDVRELQRRRAARGGAAGAVRGPVRAGGRLLDAVRRHRRVARGLEVRRRRQLRPRGLHDQVDRRLRAPLHGAGVRGAVLAQARLDDARGRQLRRLRRLLRHRGDHGPDVDLAGRGDPDRRHRRSGQHHRSDLQRAGRGHGRP